LAAQIKPRMAPASALWAEAFDDLMLDNLDGRRLGQLDHLAGKVNALATQLVVAVRAAVKRMLDDLSRRLTPTGLIMLGRAFFARRWGVGARRFVRLDEGGGIATLLFEFGDPRECGRELILQLGNQGVEFRILGPQAGDLVFKRHGREYTTS
jgi:hypothetical protein